MSRPSPSPGASGLLVAGTASDAGKSLVVTGLCRALARRGLAVAPYKAQNMSNNSAVCADGAEIGRAQYLQAQAARVEPTSAMNPVLLKPGSDRRAHVVLRGRPAGTLEAGEYATGRRHLAAAAWAAYEELSAGVDLVVAEGAGSPAEINLRAGDYVNLGLARRFGLPVVVVGDIDRGGVLAALYGTVALLEPADRACVHAFLVNKFRGDPAVLAPGLTELTARTGVPFAGVLPWLDGVWLDAEDTLEVGAWRRAGTGPRADGTLRVAVVRLPRVSNVTDVDALAAEPGVEVLVTTDPGVVAGADLVVLPGSRATLSDLDWLRRTGLADAIRARAARGAPVLGVCGGYQMLAEQVTDAVESIPSPEPVEGPPSCPEPVEGREPTPHPEPVEGPPPFPEPVEGPPSCPEPVEGPAPVPGLGLLPVSVTFAAEKTLGRPTGSWQGHAVTAYEIHHGVATPTGPAEPFLDGARRGAVWGTMWHGALENDGFRRAWLAQVAAAAGSTWRPRPGTPAYGDRREAMIETLADAVDAHVDLDLLLAPTRVAGRVGPRRTAAT